MWARKMEKIWLLVLVGVLFGVNAACGVEMVYIPGGEFEMGDHMGDPEANPDEYPVHAVYVDSFYMGKYEIKNQEYCDYLNLAYPSELKILSGVVYASDDSGNIYPYCDTNSADPCSQIDYNDVTGTFIVREKGGRDMSDDPMVLVSWYGAVAYCDYSGYRLPTEAEWEYAARGGLSGKRFSWADPNINHSLANYWADPGVYTYDEGPNKGYHPDWNDVIFPYTSVVGSFSANGYGLYDMTCNVWEWCNDWYDENYYDWCKNICGEPCPNPQGPASGSYRVHRGAGWGSHAYSCRVANRITSLPDIRWIGHGFRVVRDVAVSYYVDGDAGGSNDGSSWCDAFNYLQDALAVAEPGDTILVAEGTYWPDEDTANPSGTGSRTATFQLISGVAIKGGYAGCGEPDPDARDHETILSGDIGVIDSNTDNSYHVVTGTGVDSTGVLDGFTISGGNGNGLWPYDHGSGMFNYSGSPTVVNCNFNSNSANIAGGGMFNGDGSSPIVTSCTFKQNSCDYNGGGMANDNSSSPSLTDCNFEDNWAGNHGGGLANWNSCDPCLVNCTFSINSAGNRGGGMNNENSDPTVTDCEFESNQAVDGGGMCNYGECETMVIGCNFSSNVASNRGGGMYTQIGSIVPTVISCMFSSNSALNKGGGIYDESSNTPIINCLLIGNSANYGGGLYTWASNPNVINCTFSINSANTGGGMYFEHASNPTIVNSILCENTASSYSQIYSDGTSSPSVTYSDVQGGYGGAGNIDADPKFVYASGDDYHLQIESPCINVGDNSVVTEPNDLDGNPRIGHGVVDMGAYESLVGLYYVNGDGGNDLNDCLTPGTACETIQGGIDKANDGDGVRVFAWTYQEAVEVLGKAITVRSLDEPAVITAAGSYALTFLDGEDSNTVFENFILTGSYRGVGCWSSSPTLNHLTVVGNNLGVIADEFANPVITNSIFWGNTDGDLSGCDATDSFVDDDLVAYYPFDGDANDASGNGNDGVVNGATLWEDRCGEPDRAYGFDGMDDYVDIGAPNSLRITGALTVAAWFYAKPAALSNHPSIVSRLGWDTNRHWCWGLRLNDGMPQGWISQTGNSFKAATGENVVDSNTWHHLAMIYKPSEFIKLYLDGSLVAENTTSIPGSINNPDGVAIYVGAAWIEEGYIPPGGPPFTGRIDEVMIFDRYLPSGAVQAIYRVGLSGSNYGPHFADPDNGDYRLKSERGRYWDEHSIWVLDDVTSSCVDSGDSFVEPANERMPNGGQINQGAYGDTTQASMSEWPLVADENRDGRVNFVDFSIGLAREWLEELDWVE